MAELPSASLGYQEMIAVDVLPQQMQIPISQMSNEGSQVPSQSLILFDSIPSLIQSRLEPFDAGGNGRLQGEEVVAAFSALERELQAAQNDRDQISIAHFPSNIQSTLRLVDSDGDGVVTASEIVNAIMKHRNDDRQIRFQKKVIFTNAALLLIFTGFTAALVYGLIERSKEMTVSTDGTINVRGSQEPVKTALVDLQVVDGVLKSRCVGSCSNFNQSNAIQTSQANPKMKLSSLVDDESLAELNALTFTEGTSTAHFKVFAAVRHQDERSRTGSIVVIYTYLGEIKVDGEAISFKEAIAGALSQAGFTVDQGSNVQARRLLGAVQLIGVFNKINQAAANASLAQDYLPIAPLPSTFIAQVAEVIECTGTDCFYGDSLVDWATKLTDGTSALFQYEDLFSLEFDGHHVAKTIQTKMQWPNQSLIKLQNLTHALSYQTYQGFNYYCALTNDTSLADVITRRRRRATESPPLEFLGFANVNGIYCRRFRIINTSLEIFEDYHNNRIYQLQTSPLHFWRFISLISVGNAKETPLTSADFDLDTVLGACDPPGRIPPTRLIEGLLTNTVFPEPEWGTRNLSINSSSPPLYLNLSEPSDLYGQNFSVRESEPADEFNLQDSIRQLAGIPPENWIHVSDLGEYRAKIHTQQQRHLRELTIGQGKGELCLTGKKELRFPLTKISFLEGGSLFSLEYGWWYVCKTSESAQVAFEGRISVTSASSCPSAKGQVQFYLPFKRGEKAIVQGFLEFALSMKECFKSILPTWLVDISDAILSASLGVRFEFGSASLTERPCPAVCAAYVDRGAECRLIRSSPNAQSKGALGVTSYILTTNKGGMFNALPNMNAQGDDIAGYDRQTRDRCMEVCSGQFTQTCGGIMYKRSDGHCWIKRAAAFSNMAKDNSVDSYIVMPQSPDFYPKKDWDFESNSNLVISKYNTLAQCRSACEAENRKSSVLGDYPAVLTAAGRGFANIRVLNVQAELDVAVNAFWAGTCGTRQAKGEAPKFGVGVDLGCTVTVDFFFCDFSKAIRFNVFPLSSDSCKQPGKTYFDVGGLGYAVMDMEGKCT